MLGEGDWVRHCIFKLQGGKIDLFIFVVEGSLIKR